jgi:1,4-dihydroxy-2-naphthoate polyprenyltransferase
MIIKDRDIVSIVLFIYDTSLSKGGFRLSYKSNVNNKKIPPAETKLPDVLTIQSYNVRVTIGEIRKLLEAWWRAFRYHFAPSSFLPAILGGVVAWAQTGLMDRTFLFITVLGVTLNHIALNMTDDYFDYHAAVDRVDENRKNPYSGGSGTLTQGIIDPANMRRAFTTAYLMTIGIGLYLCAVQTWWVLVFGLFGMASSYFYTAPPVSYGYRGLGELSQLVNFSFTIGMGAYVVQTVSFSWEALAVLLPLGFMMFAMIVINEIPDRDVDAAARKNTLIVTFGPAKAIWFYGLSMSLAYAIIFLAPLFKIASFWIYTAFLTLPWALQSFGILRKNLINPLALAPANLLTIRVHNLTGILLIAAYLIRGLQNHQDFHSAIFAALLLAVFYLPAAVSIFTKKADSAHAG